jgi:sulfotransferase famil protein
LAGADPFVAALAAYYPFSPDRHICEVGQGYHRLRRAIRQANLPFRAYTVREWRHGNIHIPDTAELVISTALPGVTEALQGLLRQNSERPRHLAFEFQRGPEAVAEIRRDLAGCGVTGVRFDSLPAGLFAFAELGGMQTAEEPAPVLAHIHVPKCAGTSLRNLLERHLGTKHMRLYVDDTYFVYADSEVRISLLSDPHMRAFSSHHVRRFPPWLAGHRMLYVTFLRDPVEQFVSYMTHIKKHYAGITAQSLLEAVPPDTPRLGLRDFAKWLLTNERDVPFRENHNVNFFARHTAPNAADRLHAAKNALEGFLFVGITECMDESMRQLRALAESAGLDFPADAIAVENTSNELRDDLSWIHPSDEVGSLLLRSVELDRQLYDWAAARLKDRPDQAP